MPKLRNKPVGRLDEVDFIELRFLQMIRRKIAEQLESPQNFRPEADFAQ